MGVSARADERQALAWDLAEAAALVDRGEVEEARFWLASAREHARALGDEEALLEIARLDRQNERPERPRVAKGPSLLRWAAVALGLAQAGVLAWLSSGLGVPVLFFVLIGAVVASVRPRLMGSLLVVFGVVAALVAVGAVQFARSWSEDPQPWGLREAGAIVLSGGIPLIAGILCLVSARGGHRTASEYDDLPSSGQQGHSLSMWP